jgi:hypothetical protein
MPFYWQQLGMHVRRAVYHFRNGGSIYEPHQSNHRLGHYGRRSTYTDLCGKRSTDLCSAKNIFQGL